MDRVDKTKGNRQNMAGGLHMPDSHTPDLHARIPHTSGPHMSGPAAVGIPVGNGASSVQKRRAELDELLSKTFNAVLRIEEKSLKNKLTEGLSITEVHTIVAIGLYEANPMNVVAARLGVTLATLTTAVQRLNKKGFVERERNDDDRRKVMIWLTKRGRQVYRVHELFHKRMINEALSALTVAEERVLSTALGKVKHFFEENA
ncbi:MAG: MarR family transcriptional regulator [Eggerthellaceae bacterium]|nr:MarR family transcriptional regulator [Eggerthellaceae bacterium]